MCGAVTNDGCAYRNRIMDGMPSSTIDVPGCRKETCDEESAEWMNKMGKY